MSGVVEPVGTLEQALQHAQRLLEREPALAVEQAGEILKVVPNHPVATLLLGAARHKTGDWRGALDVLEPLARTQPNSAAVRYELGRALGSAKRGDEAVAALRRAVELKPELTEAWLALGDHLTAIGDTDGADAAYGQHIKTSTRDPNLMKAGAALCENKIAVAETLLREHLKLHPTDVTAIRMLAEVAARLGRNADAETLLARCLELAPSFAAARYNYATVLHRQHKVTQALKEISHLLASEPRNPGYRILQAAISASIGEYASAIEIYASVLSEYPKQPKAWMSYGHALKTAGRQADSVSAYRKSIELAPNLGEVWWSLANLKTFQFSAADLETMRGQLQRTDLSAPDRFHFHFAIGKALEDAGAYAESFEHYAQGNRLRREGVKYDPDENSTHVRRSKSLFTREFFEQQAGRGAAAPDPLFIVGLPRSGSTLVEQILSSHPEVEGTMELPNIPAMVRALSGRQRRTDTSRYPEILATMSAEQLRALGEQFLAETRIQRKTGTPFFIDKMPNNWAHVGLIHLVLPNARIIDARRHPLGCCFSGFKQHFARGQHFTYSLEEIGRYYRDYVELMAHCDEVLPGRVHRVLYERMIDDTEAEVRRLLEYCNLPFDDRCLRFYENERAVRTASSEQVRQPIFREGVDHWRHYEPWLGPLKEALGPALESWDKPPPL
ncbi:MAG TPA: sulfotransferase [Steroidobacteraceae bacterium]|nr:sulfotransferase [Steroidobacteraceae bacterium]